LTQRAEDRGSFDPVPILAAELNLPVKGIAAVARLLAEGATVPFIARYRKEQTGSLDEVQIRTIEERHSYLIELESTRTQVLRSIDEQGKLDDALKARILACTTKAALDDLYQPYRPKRRTRATIARERGLQPLADHIATQPDSGDPKLFAAAWVDAEKEVPDVDAALAGACDILAEQIADNADVRTLIREGLFKEGVLHTTVAKDKANERTKFEDYYDYSEALAKIPSHRFLAIRRGEHEGVLRTTVELDATRFLPRIEQFAGVKSASPFASTLRAACEDAYKRLVLPSITTDVRVEMKLSADRAAVDVFADNLRNLLLGAPLGGVPVLGIDPGLRTGCKVVALDGTGKYLKSTVMYLTQGEASSARAKADLIAFVKAHNPRAIAVGNGTGGRETEKFVREVLRAEKLDATIVVSVSEAGASVYSASDIAREEFPDLDLTLRGAISIGRRLQDPLAELVKIEPKAIGVGQYQHDVFQPLLTRKLTEVVESCVNNVGVELNTASAPLLANVSGVGPSLAKKIVQHREAQGAFKTRQDITKVAGFGPKAFMLAAGFLRIRGGAQPLDQSAVHPERYALVLRIAQDLGVPLEELIGNAAAVDKIDVRAYVSDDVGEETLRDILAELKKPGRDPRATFEPPSFREDVQTLEDLQEGMLLEGIVTNVTAFGAFVDVGVHQDGLVHVSALADRFVRDPKEVVRVGDRIKVRVVEVDLVRRRIALSAKQGESTAVGKKSQPADRPKSPRQSVPSSRGFKNNPFASLGKK